MKIFDHSNYLDIPASVYVGISRLNDNLQIHTEYLDNQEIKQFQSIQHPRRRKEFAEARILLKKMAKKRGVNKLSIHKDESTGAPYGMVNNEIVPLSITHTKQAVGGAISMDDKAIGIDIEWRKREVHPGLRERITAPAERQALKEVDTLQIWTIKEAVSKLVKTGLTKNFNKICIQQEESHTFSVLLPSSNTAQVIVIETEDFYLTLAY